ncbi:DUF4363 family protein [Clostridium sp.]|uniref:DUF4363 family protein n=1 Tax=Clostridium sp. TaxID=1506 RepID=UPI00260C5E94|nr:DUF4363 family protein [Clostridium sp.]
MRNSLISIFLFIVLLVGVIYLNTKFLDICIHAKESTDEIEEIISNKDYDLAYDKSESLLFYMDDNDGIANIYLNHTDYDLIINECLKLCIYIEERDISEALASLHVIKYSVTDLKELQKVNIKNIF